MANPADKRSEARGAARAVDRLPFLRDAGARGRFPAASAGGCLTTTPLRSPRARENDLRVHALAQGSDHSGGEAHGLPTVLLLSLCLSTFVLAQAPVAPAADRTSAKARVKDVARVQGADPNYLEGIGLVVGLPGTGDSPKELSQKLEAAWLKYRNKIEVTPKDLQNKNAAVVSVSAELPAFQQPGTYIDVHVASVGDAKSLRGGHLNIAKLYGPRPLTESEEFYATASGDLQIDGGAAGNATTAVLPRGGIVHQAAPSSVFAAAGATQSFTLVLKRPDWNVASVVASTIDGMALGLGGAVGPVESDIAQVLDPGRVRVIVPRAGYGSRPEEFVALVLSQEVLLGSPHEPDATVVINEQAGTYGVTGYVTVTPGTVQKGNVVIKIPFQDFAQAVPPNPRPQKAPNASTTVYLSDVLDNLGAVGFSTADIIDLIKQMDRAGMINGTVRSQ